jgi:hypothetical protein
MSHALSPAVGTTSRHGFLLVVLAALCWGTSGFSGKIVADRTGLGPLDIAWHRMAIGAVVLLIGFTLTRRRRAAGTAENVPTLTRGTAARLVLVAAGLGAYQLAYFAAVASAGVSIATLVALGLAPLLIAVGATVLGHGRPDRATVVALVVALVGLVLLVGISAGADSGTTVVLGALLAVGSALGYAVVTLAGAGVRRRRAAADAGRARHRAAVHDRPGRAARAALPGCRAQRPGLRDVLQRAAQRSGGGGLDRDAAGAADRDRAGDGVPGRATLPRRAGRRSARARRRRGAVPAEDGRFELPRGCPQPAFQASAIGH